MIDLRTFGMIELRSSEGHVLQSVVLQPKRVALLVYLLLTASRGFHRRDSLVALFWPELDDHRARGSLRTTLHRLRGALGEEMIIGRGAEEIAIRADGFWCDAIELERAVIAERWSDAAELYRGAFLDGFHVEGTASDFEEWIQQERARLGRLAAQAFLQASQHAEQLGNVQRALELAYRATGLQLESEPAQRHLIALLDRIGDRAGATAAYEAYAARLQTEYEIEPSAETQQLMQSVRTRGRESSAPDRLPLLVATTAIDSVSHAHSTRRYLSFAVALIAIGVIAFTGWQVTREHATIESDAAAAVPRIIDPPYTADGKFALIQTVPAGGPLPRAHAGFVFDGRNRVLMYGGNANGTTLADLWFLENAFGTIGVTWSRVEAEGAAPAPRWQHSMVYDSANDRAIIFGGALQGTSPCTAEVWLLTDASGKRRPRRWQQLTPLGAAPAARAAHVAAYNWRTNRLIVFGGHDCFAPNFDDVWVLRGANGLGESARWAKLDPEGPSPAGRSYLAGAYDVRHNRLIVVGGVDADSAFSDVWLLHNADGTRARPRWQRLETSGDRFPPRTGHTAVYDPDLNTLVVFGGMEAAARMAGLAILRGANGLDGRAIWRRFELSPGHPGLRTFHAAAYDQRSHRMVIYGGGLPSSNLTDVWVAVNLAALLAR